MTRWVTKSVSSIPDGWYSVHINGGKEEEEYDMPIPAILFQVELDEYGETGETRVEYATTELLPLSDIHSCIGLRYAPGRNPDPHTMEW